MNKYSPGNPDIGVRMLRITKRLLEGHVITSQDVMHEFGVSFATAKRDVDLIGMYLPVIIMRKGRFRKALQLPRAP